MNQVVEKLLEEDEFSFWVPNSVDVELVAKGGLEGDKAAAVGYPIRGYCSTEHLDRQNEVVVQKGLDFSEFVNHGWFNDNHKQGTTDAIGLPTKAEFHANRGWYTEGYLLKGFPPAEKIVQLAKALSPTHRRLGFSIEGKVLERDNDNKILKARVRNVAVTNCPVNTECTWELVSKAFGDPQQISDNFDKALAAGGSNPGGAGGAALRAPSLEGVSKKSRSLLTHVRSKYKTLGEAVKFLKAIRPHYSEETCERIARFAIKLTEA